MANTFMRFPIPGGDNNVGATYNEAQLNGILGILTGKLYNAAGVLTVPICRIGIDNGTYKGIAEIDTVTAVSLAGCSNSTWLAIEMAVSGTAVQFTATDIAGATDPTIIPASVKAAWDGLKGGYYLTATKRLVALAWLNAGGVLLAVVNFKGDVPWASQIGLHTGTIHEQDFPGKGFDVTTGPWDMNTTATIDRAHYFSAFSYGIVFIQVKVVDDINGTSPLYTANDAADPNLLGGGVSHWTTDFIRLYRRTGGVYDNAAYDDPLLNRGVMKVFFRDF